MSKNTKTDETWMAKKPPHISKDVWTILGEHPEPTTEVEMAQLMQYMRDAECNRLLNVLQRGRDNAAKQVQHAKNDEIMFETKRIDATQRRNAYSDSIDVFDVVLHALKTGKP